MWAFYAVLSAVFAAATSILAKVGVRDIPSNLATAVRTGVVLVMAWIVVFVSGQQTGIDKINGHGMLFLVLSGLATGASWLFYYRALQMADASKVVPIDKLSIVFTLVFAALFLHESMGIKQIAGSLLIIAGTFFMIF